MFDTFAPSESRIWRRPSYAPAFHAASLIEPGVISATVKPAPVDPVGAFEHAETEQTASASSAARRFILRTLRRGLSPAGARDRHLSNTRWRAVPDRAAWQSTVHPCRDASAAPP